MQIRRCPATVIRQLSMKPLVVDGMPSLDRPSAMIPLNCVSQDARRSHSISTVGERHSGSILGEPHCVPKPGRCFVHQHNHLRGTDELPDLLPESIVRRHYQRVLPAVSIARATCPAIGSTCVQLHYSICRLNSSELLLAASLQRSGFVRQGHACSTMPC